MSLATLMIALQGVTLLLIGVMARQVFRSYSQYGDQIFAGVPAGYATQYGSPADDLVDQAIDQTAFEDSDVSLESEAPVLETPVQQREAAIPEISRSLPADRKMNVRVVEASSTQAAQEAQQDAAINDEAVPSVVKADASASPVGKQIVDDYIGEFFAGVSADAEDVSATAHLQAERQDQPQEASESGHVAQAQCDIPILNTRVPDEMITERFIAQRDEVDEEVITVAEEKPAQLPKSVPQPAPVMSDKVVKAMLDEARSVSNA